MRNVGWERSAADLAGNIWISSGQMFLIQDVRKSNNSEIILYSLATVNEMNGMNENLRLKGPLKNGKGKKSHRGGITTKIMLLKS